MNRRPGRRPCLCKLQIAAERRHGHLAGSPQLRAYQSSVRPLPRAAPFAPPKVKTVLRRRRGPVSSAFYLDLANKEPGAAAGRVVTVNSMEEYRGGWVLAKLHCSVSVLIACLLGIILQLKASLAMHGTV